MNTKDYKECNIWLMQGDCLERIKVHKIHSKIEVIKTLSNNDILGIS